MNGRTARGTLRLAVMLCMLPASCLIAFADGEAEDGAEEYAISVFVSILPQVYFAERVGGERVRVEVLVSPGQSPHTFEPTPRQMSRLAGADLYLRIGVEFENSLMPRIEDTMPDLEVVDCRDGVRLLPIEDGHDDRGGNEEQGHGGMDPHIWLGIKNAERISATIRDALIRLDPNGRERYREGYRDLVTDLEALDRRLEEILAPVRGKPLFVFHPSFGYLAAEYGLEQVAVETGGSEPGARQLAEIVEDARSLGVRVVFVQPQFSLRSAEAIADAIGGAVVPIDPLARDYIENLEEMARKVEEGLR